MSVRDPVEASECGGQRGGTDGVTGGAPLPWRAQRATERLLEREAANDRVANSALFEERGGLCGCFQQTHRPAMWRRVSLATVARMRHSTTEGSEGAIPNARLSR